MPSAGPETSPCEAASTSSVPMMGPVQENDTSTRVKAIRKMLSMPVVLSALPSTALLQREGSLMSKAPKKLMANTTSSRKNTTLKAALVAISLSLPAPKSIVMAMPSSR